MHKNSGGSIDSSDPAAPRPIAIGAGAGVARLLGCELCLGESGFITRLVKRAINRREATYSVTTR